MTFSPLHVRAGLREYQQQAEDLLNAWRAGDADAIQLVRHRHPGFLRMDIPWLPRKLSDAEVRSTRFQLVDAQSAVARCYDFDSWHRLEEHVAEVTRNGSPVARFESAVDAVVDGDLGALTALLGREPDLVRARSARVTHFDPPVHRATLLHYVAANGVEGYRQKTPPNAVDVARGLLRAGAEVNALADMYGGHHTTLSMLVSSRPPATAGLQVALIDVLIDSGAAAEGRGSGDWASPLMTALAFGFDTAAEALVRRGARVDTLAAAAGLGRLDDAGRLLPSASSEERHRALALAAQQGHVRIVGLLLDAGENPDRRNPRGLHGHSTPLHQAVWSGRNAVVRLLVERGARLDIRDAIHEATPLGWAEYVGRKEMADYLRARGAV